MLDFADISREGPEGKCPGLTQPSYTVHNRFMSTKKVDKIWNYETWSEENVEICELCGAREVRKRNETEQGTADTLNSFLHSWYVDYS